MPLEVAKHAGFCVGVKEAVDTAFSAAQTALDKGLRCYSLGDVIHNPDVVALLSDKGVIPCLLAVEDDKRRNAYLEKSRCDSRRFSIV